MKKIFALLLALALFMSLAACGSNDAQDEAAADPTTEPTTVPTTEPFDMDGYKNLVSDCITEIYDSTIILSNIISFECKYLKTYKNIAGASGKIDVEKVVETGIKGLEEYSDYTEEYVKEQYDKISAMYKEIVLSEADNTEASEIKTTFKEMHEAYVAMYNLAFSPGTDMTALAYSHDEYAGVIKNRKATLEILLS